VALRCDSILITLTFLLAVASGGQDATPNKVAEARGRSGMREVNAQGIETKNATAEPQSRGVAKPALQRSDFKVLVWYRRDDPLGTFKYQIYDVRKGEYTTSVDAWIRNIETNYPAYIVTVRVVDLKRERGETEQLKVGSVIKRELIVAAGMSGVFLDGGTSMGPGLGFGASRAPGPTTSVGSLNRPVGSTGLDRSYLNPLPTPFPVPIPYPRPHP
jgi:hypothetical protein